MNGRIGSAAKAATVHFCFGLLVIGAAIAYVYFFWFPKPFFELAGGGGLLSILLLVDLTCGPLLTLVLYSPSKAAWKWRVDLGLIISLQLSALFYGLYQISLVRPVFLAFEGDRFRVVQAADISSASIGSAPKELRQFSFTGPKLIGVKLLKSTDPGYVESLALALKGLPPAFRPSRWTSYLDQKSSLLSQLKPLSSIHDQQKLGAAFSGHERDSSNFGYLPLVHGEITDWIVIVDRSSGLPKAYAHVDGW